MRPLIGAAAAVFLNLLAIAGTGHVEAQVGASHLWKARAFQAEDHLKTLRPSSTPSVGKEHRPGL